MTIATSNSKTRINLPLDTEAGILAKRSPILTQLRSTLRSWPIMAALLTMVALVLIACMAPWMGTFDPVQMDPTQRLKSLSALHWLGTDAYGRDVYSRAVYGARTSLMIGFIAAVTSVAFGLVIGVIAGYFRLADSIIMRVMDGVMAIPGILLAIALVSLSGATMITVLVAITVPEIPRVTRMVRSVILSVRTEPYVEAAISLGTRIPVILLRHMMPNALSPLIVQGTYIFASAMLTEAILGFLGAGIPPETPSWGNIIAQGRIYFQLIPGLILYPGILLSIAILSINILGDAMRDALDPKMSRRL